MKNQFLMKEDNYEKTMHGVKLRVSRTRNSDDGAAIFIKIGDNKRIDLARKLGNDYVDIANALADLIKEATADECKLPNEDAK